MSKTVEISIPGFDLDTPRPLPQGRAEFEAMVDRIIASVGPGLENVPRNDVKFVIATNITHLGPQEDSKPDAFFIKALRAAAAKQVAGAIFQEVKIEQQKQFEELKRLQAEETAAKEAAASDSPQKT